MEIKYSPYVVGCRIGRTIYLHPRLYEHPNLYRAVYEHELEHSDAYSTHDLKIDLINSHLKPHKREFWNFVLMHPRTLIGFLPAMKLSGKWVVDFSLSALWLGALGVVALITWGFLR